MKDFPVNTCTNLVDKTFFGRFVTCAGIRPNNADPGARRSAFFGGATAVFIDVMPARVPMQRQYWNNFVPDASPTLKVNPSLAIPRTPPAPVANDPIVDRLLALKRETAPMLTRPIMMRSPSNEAT
jgi:hypothetical protein